MVIWAVHDPLLKRDRHERASFADFVRSYQNHRFSVTVKAAGKEKHRRSALYGKWWLDNPGRRQYLGGVVFDPAGRASPDTLNLWRGWAVKPAPGRLVADERAYPGEVTRSGRTGDILLRRAGSPT